ncbi:MAG: MaoC family dehydratase [Synergistaceae bacterium]|jgi:acyl dehydratase|nr:MaoC family dehydratase [Synergistaceae bacterium]
MPAIEDSIGTKNDGATAKSPTIQRSFDELSTGMKESLSHTVTREDVDRFAELTGDRNPVHVDEEFARNSRFGRCIAHGMFGAGLISAVLGTRLPGPGNLYMDQSLKFRKPVFIGDTITATVEIVEIYPEKRRTRLSTICTNQDGVVVTEGEALLYFDQQ